MVKDKRDFLNLYFSQVGFSRDETTSLFCCYFALCYSTAIV